MGEKELLTFTTEAKLLLPILKVTYTGDLSATDIDRLRSLIMAQVEDIYIPVVVPEGVNLEVIM